MTPRIQALGLEWEGDDPEAEFTEPTEFNTGNVAGWTSPAPNGHVLHSYQKDGALFCAQRGMRALIGDEMGIGKTAQAIAAAEAAEAPRIVVICPANARYVWDREIQGWGARGAIQHLTSQLDSFDMLARWHIVTYDLITARVETWRINDAEEEMALLDIFPTLKKEIPAPKDGSYPRKINFDHPLKGVPAFVDQNRVAAWGKMMQRLRGELLEQILAAGQMLVILDEAHRAKNRASKRTKAIQRIAAGEAKVLMLTGTPLRNTADEAAVLLGLLDAHASSTLCPKKGYTLQDLKEYLNYYMIRRTKAEVMPELPAKTRQRIDISDLDIGLMNAYYDALNWAHECYSKALTEGRSEAEARQSMLGGIEKARTALGLAKVRGSEVVDLVLDVVENKGCCVVFCVHQLVSDELKAKLEAASLRVGLIDGRVPQITRAEIVMNFQEERLDVLIGGIKAAGEAITLTRADTVIFVELDWVPAALLQAEDRIHRVGQRSNCQVIQLTARVPQGENLDEMMVDLLGVKMARIGAILDEDTTPVVGGGIQAEVYQRLLGKARQGVSVVPTKSSSASTKRAALPKEPHTPEDSAVELSGKRRGRPKVYVDTPAPSTSERSQRSIQTLTAAGGKRLMLRLTPEAYEALKVIMALTGNSQETGAINQALIARKQALLGGSDDDNH